MDKIEIIAADAIIVLDEAAYQIEVAAEESIGALDRSIFLVVAGEIREAEKRLRSRLRSLLGDRALGDR